MKLSKRPCAIALATYIIFASAQASEVESEAGTKTSIISGPFGSELVPVPDNPKPRVSAYKPLAQDGHLTPINDAAMASTPQVAQARIARVERATLKDTSVWEGIKAGVSMWSATRLINGFSRPSFDNDKPISMYEYLATVPLVLTEDEREFFMGTAKGLQSADYAITQIEKDRSAENVLKDHPVVSFIFGNILWLSIAVVVVFTWSRRKRTQR